MKKLLCLFLFVILISCEKEKCLQCELEQTFTLVFQNYKLSGDYGFIKYLVIDSKKYYVEYAFDKLYFDVPVNKVNTIYVIERNNFNIQYMIAKPNVCATYNYFW